LSDFFTACGKPGLSLLRDQVAGQNQRIGKVIHKQCGQLFHIFHNAQDAGKAFEEILSGFRVIHTQCGQLFHKAKEE
jgi:hypothetical protein